MADQETAGTEVKAVSVAPADTKLTIVAGRIVLVAATETGGSFKSVKKPKTEFQPEIVIDYAMGKDISWDKLKKLGRTDIDPRFILEKPDPKSKTFWSLGKHGWIVLGFPQGFPASQDYQLSFLEVAEQAEVVDFYIAQQIDSEHPVNKDQEPYVHNRVFGDAGTNADPLSVDVAQKNIHFMQAMGKQTLPGDGQMREGEPMWPPWIPKGNWRYLGWLRGKVAKDKEERWVGQLNLGYIPQGNYFYLLLHDRSENDLGADVDAVKISLVHTDLFVLLMIDNSFSAAEQINKYKEGVCSIISKLPIDVKRNVSLGVRFIEDDRKLTDQQLAAERDEAIKKGIPESDELKIPTRRHNFASGNMTPVYWQLLNSDNITTVTDKICDSIKMNRRTSPLLAALSAVRHEECEHPSLDEGALRIILITDGLPDSYNRYNTPSKLSVPEEQEKKQEEVKAAIIQRVVPRLKNIQNKLTDPRQRAYPDPLIMADKRLQAYADKLPRSSTISFQLFGVWGPGDAWLKETWAKLDDPLMQVQDLPLPPDKPQVLENMHRIPHTDCINGSKKDRQRIGPDKDETYRDLGQPLPLAWK